jgi:hypothetical protein
MLSKETALLYQPNTSIIEASKSILELAYPAGRGRSEYENRRGTKLLKDNWKRKGSLTLGVALSDSVDMNFQL